MTGNLAQMRRSAFGPHLPTPDGSSRRRRSAVSAEVASIPSNSGIRRIVLAAVLLLVAGALCLAGSLGIDVAAWPHWAERESQLASSVLGDVTSVMNLGIIVGALLAAGLAGRFAPVWRSSPSSVLSAIIGGLLLGYGAILAFGCNIGALFSGVASGSLHGWLWVVAAFAGNIIGARLRPWFGQDGAVHAESGPRPAGAR